MVTSEDVEIAKPAGAGRITADRSFAAGEPDVVVCGVDALLDLTGVDECDCAAVVPGGDALPPELQAAISVVTITTPIVIALVRWFARMRPPMSVSL